MVSTVAGEECRAFIPNPLPPDPSLVLTDDDYDLMEKANRALGRLDGLATLLPDTTLFIYFYIRKEAVLSSQIEGTQSSIADLLLYESSEAPGVPLNDVQEVSSYVAAMNHGLKRLGEGFPLSLRLLREIHEVLLSTGRGSTKSPGEFRRSQNWIGGTRPGNARASIFASQACEYNSIRSDRTRSDIANSDNRSGKFGNAGNSEGVDREATQSNVLLHGLSEDFRAGNRAIVITCTDSRNSFSKVLRKHRARLVALI